MHHMAFEVATVDEVLKARAWLEANGVGILFEGRRRAGAQVAVEFRDPDGHWLEIYWGLDRVPEGPDGPREKAAIRPPEERREVFSLEDALDDAQPG